jgi:hypothetical protein
MTHSGGDHSDRDHSGDRRLRSREVAALLGVKPKTWSAMVARPPQDPDNPFPEKIPFVEGDGRDRRQPEWWESDIARYAAGRGRQGQRNDLKRRGRGVTTNQK